MTLGTILPTRKSLAVGDAAADAANRKQLAEGAKLLGHLNRRVVGGEVRYYETATRYAKYTRFNEVRWFEVRADGDYAVSR